MKQKEYISLSSCIRAAIAAKDLSEFVRKAVLKVSSTESKYQTTTATFEKHRLLTRLWVHLLETHEFTRANEWWDTHQKDIRTALNMHYKGMPECKNMTSDWKIRDYLIVKNLVSDNSNASPYTSSDNTYGRYVPTAKTIEETLDDKVEDLKREYRLNRSSAPDGFHVSNSKNPYYAYIEHKNPTSLDEWIELLIDTKKRAYSQYPNESTEFKDELRAWAFVRRKVPMPITLFLLRGDYYPAMTLGSGNVTMDPWDLACARVLLRMPNKILAMRRLKSDSNVADNLRFNDWPYPSRLDPGLLHLAENIIPALNSLDEFEELYKSLVAFDPSRKQEAVAEIEIEHTWIETP